LAAATPKQILVRMLYTLFGIAQGKGDIEAARRYVDAVLTIAPEMRATLERGEQ
jgi:hypothetical protein